MKKHILAVGALAACLVLVPASSADAHLAGTVYKPTYRHISSYDCSGQFKQVPNLDNHPAVFQCEALVTAFDILCANPKGKINRGNSGPRTVIQSAYSVLTNADITDKKKGIASKTMLLPDVVLDAADEICKDRNLNWFAVDELVTAALVSLRSFDCLDDDCIELEQATESLLKCTLPDGYDIVDNPPPGNGVPTEYDCELIEEAHCDRGDTCPIELPEVQAGAALKGALGETGAGSGASGCQSAGGASLLGLAAALLMLRRSRTRR